MRKFGPFGIVSVGLILLFGSNAMAGEKETAFWNWFSENEQSLYNFETDQERVFDQLQIQMHKVDPNLTFEFGPRRDDGTREFVISADGIIESFPAVERLYAAAPSLKRWKFVKFRPRRTPMQVCVGDRCVDPKEVHFRLFRDGEKIGILLFFEGYDDADSGFYRQVGYLLLDEALGEFTVETKVGFIEFADRNSQYFAENLTLPVLAAEFDHAAMQ